MSKYIALFLVLSLHLTVSASDKLIPELEKFRPFIGKTYRGEFDNSTPDKRVIDVSRWERHLNGQAIRIEHSINNGEYGGETIIFYDKAKRKLRYFYFTTAGFYTEADVTFNGKTMISREKVTGNDNGVTEVKSKAWIQQDGSIKTQAHYLKNGEWVKGHGAVYQVAPDAEVIFQ